ncbi:MAG: HIT domain-containing protein [Phycisphaerae bacterium]|nr:HIT domain-containing protein [Phycisphaerae bacterium]
MLNNNNLWAPWRSQYLQDLGKDEQQGIAGNTCFICDYVKNPEKDRKNLVLWRSKNTIMMFNRYPYTAGHLLIAPQNHIANFVNLEETVLLELMTMCRDGQKILQQVLQPQGFNVGFNVGKCSGAGLPGHIHMHVVPRWEGDTNFMTTLAGARLASQALDDLFDHVFRAGTGMKLPENAQK